MKLEVPQKQAKTLSVACDLVVVVGEFPGKPTSVVLDSGSYAVIVKGEFVPVECLTGQATSAIFLDKTTNRLEEAYITVSTHNFSGKVFANCRTYPLYDLVLGNAQGERGKRSWP